MSHIRTAVFPIAGLGTRFLPATKSIPKEMLPLVDRPLIQYAVDEARDAGIEEFVFVTAAGKGALEDYFDTAEMLETRLKAAGKTKALDALAPSAMPDGALSFVRQGTPRGLGHAVSLARRIVGDRPFAVLLPDDVILGARPALSQMLEAHARHRGHMLATMEVPRAETSKYGIIDTAQRWGRMSQATGLVEKPSPADAPSCEAVVGRYILEPQIFDALAATRPGAGGEIQLTDAINAQAASVGAYGYCFDGTRFDCGSVEGFVEATVAVALQRPDINARFPWDATPRLPLSA